MKGIHIGMIGPVRAEKTTLAQALAARTDELFQNDTEQSEAAIWEVKCIITSIHLKGDKQLVNKDVYNVPISKLGCEVGKPFKIFFEKGCFMVHQVVKAEPKEDDYGFWVETTTKLWRFDYI